MDHDLRIGTASAAAARADQREVRAGLAEVARLGGKVSAARTPAHTDMAQFWAPRDVRLVLRQLVGTPGRTLLQDARFLALAEMAWADS